MKFVTRAFLPLSICISLLSPTFAHADWLCSWLGIGCRGAAAVDQENPPEVFSFTVSGTFEDWTDIPPETFVCDTREHEDRSCRWRVRIPEIKRYATVVFEPFPHDLGMYKVRAVVEHNLGRDLDYGATRGIQIQEGGINMVASFREISITEIAKSLLVVEIRKSNYRGQIDWKSPTYGRIELKFQDVIK